jgi:hypothetical protein
VSGVSHPGQTEWQSLRSRIAIGDSIWLVTVYLSVVLLGLLVAFGPGVFLPAAGVYLGLVGLSVAYRADQRDALNRVVDVYTVLFEELLQPLIEPEATLDHLRVAPLVFHRLDAALIRSRSVADLKKSEEVREAVRAFVRDGPVAWEDLDIRTKTLAALAEIVDDVLPADPRPSST